MKRAAPPPFQERVDHPKPGYVYLETEPSVIGGPSELTINYVLPRMDQGLREMVVRNVSRLHTVRKVDLRQLAEPHGDLFMLEVTMKYDLISRRRIRKIAKPVAAQNGEGAFRICATIQYRWWGYRTYVTTVRTAPSRRHKAEQVYCVKP